LGLLLREERGRERCCGGEGTGKEGLAGEGGVGRGGEGKGAVGRGGNGKGEGGKREGKGEDRRSVPANKNLRLHPCVTVTDNALNARVVSQIDKIIENRAIFAIFKGSTI